MVLVLASHCLKMINFNEQVQIAIQAIVTIDSNKLITINNVLQSLNVIVSIISDIAALAGVTWKIGVIIQKSIVYGLS